MKRMLPVLLMAAALIGYIAGYASKLGTNPGPQAVRTGHIDDIRKAHAELTEKAMKAAAQPGSGSSQSFGGGPVHIQTRNFSIFMLYRAPREHAVLRLKKVNSDGYDEEL